MDLGKELERRRKKEKEKKKKKKKYEAPVIGDVAAIRGGLHLIRR